MCADSTTHCCWPLDRAFRYFERNLRDEGAVHYGCSVQHGHAFDERRGDRGEEVFRADYVCM